MKHVSLAKHLHVRQPTAGELIKALHRSGGDPLSPTTQPALRKAAAGQLLRANLARVGELHVNDADVADVFYGDYTESLKKSRLRKVAPKAEQPAATTFELVTDQAQLQALIARQNQEERQLVIDAIKRSHAGARIDLMTGRSRP